MRHHPTGPQEIYRLYDPLTLATHYIGHAKDARTRLRGHIKESLRCARDGWLSPNSEGQNYVLNPRKRLWIVRLHDQKQRPGVEVIEHVENPLHTELRELLWLLHYWQQGETLYNYDTVAACDAMRVLVQQHPYDLLHVKPGAPIWQWLYTLHRQNMQALFKAQREYEEKYKAET